MIDEELAGIAMQLIGCSGDAKSHAMSAMRAAAAGDFEASDSALQAARTALGQAHVIQTELMTREIREGIVEKSVILIHAQDHFIGAVTTIDVGDFVVRLSKRVAQLEAAAEVTS